MCAFRAHWGDKEPKKRKDRGGYPVNIIFDGPSEINPTLLKEQLHVDLVVFREPASSYPGIVTLPGAAGSLILGHGCRKGRVYVSFGIDSTTQWGSEIVFSITDDALCQELHLVSRTFALAWNECVAATPSSRLLSLQEA